MAIETFKDIGLIFDSDGNCDGCLKENCINNVESKIDGREYCVHISTNKAQSIFRVHAYENANTESEGDTINDFDQEKEAVKYVCNTFRGFKCA